MLMVIINKIFPEKSDLSVECSLNIFKILYIMRKFLEILNDMWMFLCEHMSFLKRM